MNARPRPVRSRGVAALVAWACALALLNPAAVRSQGASADVSAEREPADTESDTRARAGFLARFGGFVQWPAQAFAHSEAPLVIGLIDADAVADDLTGIVGRHMPQGRTLVVRRLKAGEPTTGVHVLYIGSPINRRLPELLAHVRTSPVLTVTEHPDALSAGSIVNFAVIDGRLRFEVSLKSAARSGLSISARLLSAAARVEPLP